MKKLPLFLALVLIVACNNKTHPKGDREPKGKGLIEGNGGSGPSYRSNPWFLGAKPVSYCIRRGNNFSVSEEQLKGIVSDVLESWTSVVDNLIDDSEKPKLAAKGIEYSKSYVLAKSCEENTDLVLAFGSPDAHIDQVIKYSSKNLVGFASLINYDIKALRGRGAIYIAPDNGKSAYVAKDLKPGFWADHDKLFDVLLHEVGHVMGFEHDKTSFMAEYFPGYRLMAERKGHLSANMLLARHIANAGFNICGKPWYENGDEAFVADFMSATRICFKKTGFDSSITVEGAAGNKPVSYPISGIDSTASSTVSSLFTETEELSLGSYADDYSAYGTLQKGDIEIPMAFNLKTEGFVLKLYDPNGKRWSEVVALSDELRIFNDVEH